MKTVILCGGLGTRLSEETHAKPKPMIEIGDRPILWHILKQYSFYGFNDFVLALGYKGFAIQDYFINYRHHSPQIAVNLASQEVRHFAANKENWNMLMVDTGEKSMTGGRLRRLETILREEGTFMLTYGDGVSNVDIDKLVTFHKSHGQVATITAVRPPARFGTMCFDGTRVTEFKEKPQTGEGWINGGFLVFESRIFDYLESDETILEAKPLERLAKEGQLQAFKHEGFWQCMDTIRDKKLLEDLWVSENPPWKLWV